MNKLYEVGVYNSLKVGIHSTLDSMGLKPKINISSITVVQIILVQNIIQALIQVFEVEKNHYLASFHADFNFIYVTTNLFTSMDLTYIDR